MLIKAPVIPPYSLKVGDTVVDNTGTRMKCIAVNYSYIICMYTDAATLPMIFNKKGQPCNLVNGNEQPRTDSAKVYVDFDQTYTVNM